VRAYEIVYVIRPDLTDEERTNKVERIYSLITENGGRSRRRTIGESANLLMKSAITQRVTTG